MATVGDPDGLLRSWNTTRTAATTRLEAANILPVALDEIATAGTCDEVLEAVVFGVATGASRGRGRAGGGLRDETRWSLVLLSSGERRLSSVSGLSGVRARVLEIPSPVTTEREAIERVVELAASAHGWPLAWLAADPQLDQVAADAAALAAEVSGRAEDSMSRTIRNMVALCATGFLALARAVGVQVPREDVARAARQVAEDALTQVAEDGLSAADRLYEALLERVARRPWAYPPKGVNGPDGRDREGVRLDEAIAFFPTIVNAVGREIGLPDTQAALQGMAADGRLLRGEGKHLTRRVRIGGELPWTYVVAVPTSEGVGTGVGTYGGNRI